MRMGDLTMHDIAEDVGDLFLGEDIDLNDETVLRDLQGAVSSIVGSSRGVRISVLSVDQWLTAVDRLVPKALRRGVRQHFHVLGDPKSRSHLLVGPTTLAGLNENSHQITAEVVYAILKAGRPVPPPLFQRGSADLLASEVARKIQMPFFTQNYPREAQLCAEIIAMLQRDHVNCTQLEWLQVLKTDPRRFIATIGRGEFGKLWRARALEAEPIRALIDGSVTRARLTDTLRERDWRPDDDFIVFTRRCLDEHANHNNRPQGDAR